MFEFSLEYHEPGYHKSGDPPFQFPPEGEDNQIDANIIEIQGRNGTGKTTLLNVLALALGYLDRERELETKPVLRNKLQALDENTSLQYKFHIVRKSSNQNDSFDLVLKRRPGAKPTALWNSQPVSIAELPSKLDVIFLTEDDPEKVLNASKGKLTLNLQHIEKQISSLQQTIMQHIMNINEYTNFKERETKLKREIQDSDEKIKTIQLQLQQLHSTLKKAQLKDELKEILALLNRKDDILEQYKNCKKQYDKIKGKKEEKLIRTLARQRHKAIEYEEEIRAHKRRIKIVCDSLDTYGVKLGSRKLMYGDHTEFNSLYSKISTSKKSERTKKALVDDMIRVFEKYSTQDIVPILDKPIHEVLRELRKINRNIAFDRVLSLCNELRNILEKKDRVEKAKDTIEEKIIALEKNLNELGNIKQIEQGYRNIEKEYLKLQNALQRDRSQVITQWGELVDLTETPQKIKADMAQSEVQLGVEQKIKSQRTRRLQIEQENAVSEPRFFKNATRIEKLNKTISHLREKLFHWIRILQTPAQGKEYSSQDTPGFGSAEYQQFVSSVGKFLGKQFEPFTFAGKSHQIAFFDIEGDMFVTTENRKIKIRSLSQGQSKITTLTGSFKDLDAHKHKILLIDEIADLDPANMERVKNTLRDTLHKGSLALAVVVRPSRTQSSKMVDIIGWN